MGDPNALAALAVERAFDPDVAYRGIAALPLAPSSHPTLCACAACSPITITVRAPSRRPPAPPNRAERRARRFAR